jgi:hypothetical protein
MSGNILEKRKCNRSVELGYDIDNIKILITFTNAGDTLRVYAGVSNVKHRKIISQVNMDGPYTDYISGAEIRTVTSSQVERYGPYTDLSGVEIRTVTSLK